MGADEGALCVCVLLYTRVKLESFPWLDTFTLLPHTSIHDVGEETESVQPSPFTLDFHPARRASALTQTVL